MSEIDLFSASLAFLLEWLERQPESRAVLIETALCSWYQIPEHVKAPKAVPPAIRNDKKS